MLQPKKPKLSRKIVQSSKVNLNLHWDSFEEDDMTKDFDLSLKIHSDTTTSSNFVNVHVQNAINDNLANERAELFIISKQQLIV